MQHHNIDGVPAPRLVTPQLAPLQPAGLIERHKDEAPGWQAEGDEENTEPNPPYSPQTDCDMQPGDAAQAASKRFRTQKAALAPLRFALNRIEGARGLAAYTVIRWNLSRDLATLDYVTGFADRVGA